MSLAAAEEAGVVPAATYARILLAVEGTTGADPAGAEHLLTTAEQALHRAGDEWGLALATFVRAEIGFRTGSLRQAEAERLAERAAAGFAGLGDRWGHSAVLGHHGTAVRVAGRPAEAVPLIERSARLAGELGLLLTLQWMQAELAYCALLLDDRDTALRRCAEAEETARRLGAGPGASFAALARGVDARRRGDLASARSVLAPAVEQLVAAGIGGLAAALAVQLGHTLEQSGELAAADRTHRRALELGGAAALPSALEGLACVAVAGAVAGGAVAGGAVPGRAVPGRAVAGGAVAGGTVPGAGAERAAQLLGAAAAERDRAGRPADAVEQADRDRAMTACRVLLGDERVARALAEGRRTGPGPLVEG
ncbi:hypothetical protein ACL02T_13625 [Pseudonocardia sp. RS010]|uniref:hypothetical protein n=1 Tax=Pseudonocardia sp. RS010 TaxID=3385979 RepID=UPI00399FD700